jgi:hypothetical protein
LESRRDVAEFTDIFRNLAQSENMEFYDRSAQTLEERKALSISKPDMGSDNFALNIGVHDGSGMGVGASDLVGSHYQVALGFSEGASRSTAARFANDVIHRLKTRWTVDIYPDGEGVKSDAGCGKP